MIVPERASFKDFDGLQDWIVRGPQGEYYGRYKNHPKRSQIPLYATVEKEKKGFRMALGEPSNLGVF